MSGCSESVTSASSATAKENFKDSEKHYTLTEIILVAFGCLLLGAVLSALLFVLYMKRTHQGCFLKHMKEAQGNSKHLSGPGLQFPTESVVIQKYDPNNSKSAHTKKENIAEETHYQSLSSNQFGNDQQTYDELKMKEPRSGLQDCQPSSSHLQQTGNYAKTDYITKLQNKTEGIDEYSRDRDEHNYFILDAKPLQEKVGPGIWDVQKPRAYVGDEVNYTTLGTEDKQSDASHEYFILEHMTNINKQD